jgi:hypothetical protein
MSFYVVAGLPSIFKGNQGFLWNLPLFDEQCCMIFKQDDYCILVGFQTG